MAEVVGTSILFGLILSLIGGGFHLSAGQSAVGNQRSAPGRELMLKLTADG